MSASDNNIPKGNTLQRSPAASGSKAITNPKSNPIKKPQLQATAEAEKTINTQVEGLTDLLENVLSSKKDKNGGKDTNKGADKSVSTPEATKSKASADSSADKEAETVNVTDDGAIASAENEEVDANADDLYEIDWREIFEFDPRVGEESKQKHNPTLVKIKSPFQGYVHFVHPFQTPHVAKLEEYKKAYRDAMADLKTCVESSEFAECVKDPPDYDTLASVYAGLGTKGLEIYETGIILSYIYGQDSRRRGVASIVEKSMTKRITQVCCYRRQLLQALELLQQRKKLLTQARIHTEDDSVSDFSDLSDEEFDQYTINFIKDMEKSHMEAKKGLAEGARKKTRIVQPPSGDITGTGFGAAAITSTAKAGKKHSKRTPAFNERHQDNPMARPGFSFPPNPYLRPDNDDVLTGANAVPVVELRQPNTTFVQANPSNRLLQPVTNNSNQNVESQVPRPNAHTTELNAQRIDLRAPTIAPSGQISTQNAPTNEQQGRISSLESNVEQIKAFMARIESTLQSQQEQSRNVTVGTNFQDPVTYYSNIDPLSDSYLSTLPDGFNIRPDQGEYEFIHGVGSTKIKDKIPTLLGETNYDSWKAAFIHHVYRYRINVALKVNYLKETVDMKAPVIRQIVEYVKADAIGFRTIVQKLHQHYGNLKTYRSVLFTRLFNSQLINIRERASTEAFANDLQRYVDNQFREGLYHELQDEANALYQTLASRLTPASRDAFAQWCQISGQPLHTLSMLNWLSKVCEMKDDASFYLRGSSSVQPENVKQNPVSKRREVNFCAPAANYHNDNYGSNCHFGQNESKCFDDCHESIMKYDSFHVEDHEHCGITDEDLHQLVESEACFQANLNRAQVNKCPKCLANHTLDKCADFLALSPTQRRDFFISTYCFCYLCLKQGHLATQCKYEACHCGKRHHKLLHGANPLNASRTQVKKFVPNSQQRSKNPQFRPRPTGKDSRAHVGCVCVDEGTDATLPTNVPSGEFVESDSDGHESDKATALNTQVKSVQSSRRRVGLRTFPVIVKNQSTGKSQRINALLDDGSTVTMLCDTVAKKLKLPKVRTDIPVQICGIGGVSAGFSTHKVSFALQSDSGDFSDICEAQLFNSPCEQVAPSYWLNREEGEFEDIAFGEPVHDKIRLIIGTDCAKYHISLEDRASKAGKTFARRTPLGWTAIGEMSNADTTLHKTLKVELSEGAATADSKKVEANNHTVNSLFVMCGEPPFRMHDQLEDQKLSEILQRQSDLCRFHDDDVVVPKLSEEEEYALNTLKSSVKLVSTGSNKFQYEVSTLWKRGEPNFTSNLNYAIKRLKSTIRNKLSNTQLMDTYESKLKGWLDSNYTEPSKPALEGEQEFYLPHFPVIREDKTTTKVRPVMDAAARCRGPDGEPKCLNDALLEGPKLINSLPEVLLRFRRHRVAIIGDLREMFLQVILPEADRKFHKFVWLDRATNELVYYQFKVHCFGNRSSPAVAIFTIKHHAEQNRAKYPRAAETVLESTIVDDNCDSVDTVAEALTLIKDLKQLYITAGLDIRKWVSNNKSVLSEIPDSDKAENVVFNYDFDPESNMPKIKALGVIWLAEKDEFTFLSDISRNSNWTKRSVLSAYSKLFDPLGFISPIAITARIITQACWRHGVGWDEPLPDAVLKQWQKWVDDLVYLPQIRVPRCVKPLNGKVVKQEFHIFCDASTDGLGAVAYAKSITGDNQCYVNLIMSKARVTPVKTIGINKLELESAVIAVTLAKTLKRVYQADKEDLFFWTDSKNVLAWLNTKKCLKRFVANRVTDIAFSTDISSWRHVPGINNPADDLTRGLTTKQLLDSKRWWQGPEFLQHVGRDSWPEQPNRFDKHVLDVVQEKILGVPFDNPATAAEEEPEFSKDDANICTVFITGTRNDNFIKYVPNEPFVERFSNWTRCVNTFCYIWRWIRAVRNKMQNRTKIQLKNTKFESKNASLKTCLPPHRRNFTLTPSITEAVPEISAEEYSYMESKLIKLEQRKYFTKDTEDLYQFNMVKSSSSLYQLNPQFDTNGVMRVYGRLKDSKELHIDQKHPILLPKRQHITVLLIRHYHRVICNHYGGTNYLLSVVRTKFWPVNGYSVAKDIVIECSICNVKKPCPKKQQMATLPEFRLPIEDGNRVFAWHYTACDYGGPFEVKPSIRGQARCKRWLCLFTCMNYRMVHLEVVHSLKTSSFLQAFERFVARNARPRVIYMDNMRTFVKGEEEITNWILNNNKKLFRESHFKDIKFEFIPPLSPHFGGVWESLIKLAKRAFYDVIKPGDLNDEQLLTAFTKAEGLLNARPLTNVSSDPDDPVVLTPAHFQVREAFRELPAPASSDTREQYLYLQGVMDNFWERFIKEVVPLRNKYAKDVKQMEEPYKVGDLVVLLEDLDRQKTWPVAKITAVEKSHDGLVRKATLYFNGKEYKRSIKSFCKLNRASLNW